MALFMAGLFIMPAIPGGMPPAPPPPPSIPASAERSGAPLGEEEGVKGRREGFVSERARKERGGRGDNWGLEKGSDTG